MCLFVETQYQCKHTCFELYLFCQKLFNQLNRITDATQDKADSLPFDPYSPFCEPYAYMGGPGWYLGWDGICYGGTMRTNIVHRVVDLLEMSPYCVDAHGLSMGTGGDSVGFNASCLVTL